MSEVPSPALRRAVQRRIAEDDELTQLALAKRAKVSANTVQNFLAGKSMWPTTIIKIAKAAEVDLDGVSGKAGDVAADSEQSQAGGSEVQVIPPEYIEARFSQLELDIARAEAIAAYLQRLWSIETGRSGAQLGHSGGTRGLQEPTGDDSQQPVNMQVR